MKYVRGHQEFYRNMLGISPECICKRGCCDPFSCASRCSTAIAPEPGMISCKTCTPTVALLVTKTKNRIIFAIVEKAQHANYFTTSDWGPHARARMKPTAAICLRLDFLTCFVVITVFCRPPFGASRNRSNSMAPNQTRKTGRVTDVKG